MFHLPEILAVKSVLARRTHFPSMRSSSKVEESLEDATSGKTFLQFPFAERTFSVFFPYPPHPGFQNVRNVFFIQPCLRCITDHPPVGNNTESADRKVTSSSFGNGNKPLDTRRVFRPHVVTDGIAIVVNPKNGIESISLDDVAGIYLGTITKWSEIAPGAMTGTSDTIVVIGRDSASGTRSYFDEEILKKQTPAPAMLEKNSNGAVLQTVAQTPGSIGYVSIGFVSNDVKALPSGTVMTRW